MLAPMSQPDLRSAEFHHCPSVVTLPQTDVDHYNTVPRGAFLIDPRLRCDLAGGHGGTHCALVQGVGFDLHWASWPEYLVEVGPRCPAVGPYEGPEPPRDPNICLLREDHPGPHYGETWF